MNNDFIDVKLVEFRSIYSVIEMIRYMKDKVINCNLSLTI